jgi:DNA ligase D-like protein (predicted ligase)
VRASLAALGDDARHKLEKTGMPRWTAPMLAVLTHDYFSSEDWLYERKLDGERCLVFRDGRGLRILSRNRQKLNDTYPELADALAAAGPRRFVADGEIVAFDGSVTSFSRLQQRIGIRDPDRARASGVTVYLYLFDLLYLDHYALEKLPLRRRKGLLRDAFHFGGNVRYTPHRNERGEAYYEEACRKGWEGVIAKRADSRYAHTRSRNWLKFKCVNRQELVIGGYTDPHGSRRGFGALLLGYYDDGKLRYAGKVGTGFDDELLQSLHGTMTGYRRDSSPFAEPVREKGAHWITPTLVAEIGFTEWTGSGRLRHPRFIGLRDDKPAREVTRERPARRTTAEDPDGA